MGGGNSLLDCVVFGRVSGKAAAKYILGDDVKETSLAELNGGGLSGKVEGSKLSGGSYEVNMNEVAKHTTKTDCWVVVRGEVLNVTSFLSQHPGGELAILTFAGKDATAEFDMIHPPDVIGKYAPDACIGKLGEGGGDEEEEEEADAEAGGAGPEVAGVLAVRKSF